MKNVKLMAMICLAAVAFAACGDDENQEADPLEVFTGKRLVKVEMQSYPTLTEGEEFTYSNGKLTGYADYEKYNNETEARTYEITYTGNTVTVTCLSKTDGEKEENVYTLNAEGYAVSMVHTTIEEYGGQLHKDTYHNTFEYSDGYLVKAISNDGEVTEIRYKDGDVVSYSQLGHTYLCTASTNLNKGGILPFYGWLGDAGSGELVVAHYAGILGKPTTHLLSTEGNYTYTYTLDGEYVKTCTATWKSGTSETKTYTFN